MQGKRLTDAASFFIFLTGILLFLALATHRPEAPANMVGRAGNHAAGFLILLLGRASFLIPLYLVYLGGQALYRGELVDGLVRLSSMIVTVSTAAIWVGLISEAQTTGWVGETIGGMLQFAFGKWGGFILSFGLFLPAAFLATGVNMSETLHKASDLITKLDNQPPNEDEASMAAKEVKRTAMVAGLGLASAWLLDRWNSKPGQPDLASQSGASDDGAGSPLLETRLEDNLPFFQKLAPENGAHSPSSFTVTDDSRSSMEDRPQNSNSIFGGVRVSESRRVPAMAKAQGLAKPKQENPLFPGHFNLDQSRFVFKKYRAFGGPGHEQAAAVIAPQAEHAAQTEPYLQPSIVTTLERQPVVSEAEDFQAESYAQAHAESQAESAEQMVAATDVSELSAPPQRAAAPAPLPISSDLSKGFTYTAPESTHENFESNPEADFEDEDLEEIASADQWVATHVPPVRRRGGRYNLPTDILALSPVIPEQDVGREIENTKMRLEKTLHDFDVPGKVTNIQRGPIITLFEVLLDPGVRASRILRIETEIRMNLAVPSVRIVAPLPNKTTVGIEVPNAIRQTVTVGEIIRKDKHFFSRENLLGIALGKDISGRNHYMDIARMPHVLIAGASGQGKSVFMNSMIASLLYRYSPEEVRFIMIDPKMVELTLFEGIPHLLTPVITEPSLAGKVLDWILMEMETRYTHFKRVRCRDIVSYNERVKADKSGQPIPYIVIVIDELADLMQTSSKEVENALWRLAQKARAVGIHMILATQRPSVDVITPHIKSNAPARIAFKVAQKTDSRIILDESGGEALLGQGDMLYRSPQSTIDRIQSPLITEQEMAAIVTETRRYGEPVFIDLAVSEAEASSLDEEEPIDAELLAEAWKIIQETGKTSGSYLQRRLRIGYNRAANVVEALEEKGYLGPAIGNRPREILKRT